MPLSERSVVQSGALFVHDHKPLALALHRTSAALGKSRRPLRASNAGAAEEGAQLQKRSLGNA